MIAEFLVKKFGSPDYKSNAEEWSEILKDKENLDQERIEKTLKETPGFTFLEVINFAVYYNELSNIEISNKSIEDHFIEWQNKIKK